VDGPDLFAAGCWVEHIGTVSRARLHEPDSAQARLAPHAEYPVGEFLRSAGLVIVTCLALAASAHILVAIVGQY
jgi:hypothetical protein